MIVPGGKGGHRRAVPADTIYSGGVQNNLVFPIGSYLAAFDASGSMTRNKTITVSWDGTRGDMYDIGGTAPNLLAGVWQVRGQGGTTNISCVNTASYLVQRIA